jgi:hypothetical protein
MKFNNKQLILFSLLFFVQHITFAQDERKEEHGEKGSSRLTLGLGHTHISEGKVDGKTEWIVMPSWSFNFDYWISNKVAIGLQQDLVTESFVVENSHGEEIERSSPWSIVPVVIFKPGKHFSFIGGAGIEIAKHENLGLMRLGIEYGWHLPEDWELGAALVWDGKWKYYNSWGLAFTISKIFPKHH